MRRWLPVLALACVTTVLLAGCGPARGADGDLTDDWPELGAPKPFTPATDTCLPRITSIVQASTYETVDCARSHLAESIHVGAFTGPAAKAGARPGPGSPALRAARGECDQRAREMLGGDWHTARLTLSLALPSAPAWAGGARWFRCDLSETDSIDNTRPVNRSGSLRGALIGDAPLTHRCFDPKLIGDNLNYMAPVLCTEPHRAEFVGVYVERDMSWVEFTRSAEQAHRRCMALIAGYAAVPNNADLPYRAGSIYYPPSQREWEEGDRGVRCFLWSDDRKLTRSMRGAGPEGLPAI
ncbi:septum formation family protein [Micromonospora sp. ALFpr18c]|uniref:septum formation family protein n=1 Tax=unclassified Micromonospora TaxID=2617518 RepID=UPI00124B5789|nr:MULTISPECIES: septum formation family protein [unclassified Micromonospora]KAB1948960.1 septum formation family protein [Micromonospora sp. ALFpr18c]MDG4758669.1 septum formation family protein [Micromonospora sp. WMMD710]